MWVFNKTLTKTSNPYADMDADADASIVKLANKLDINEMPYRQLRQMYKKL